MTDIAQVIKDIAYKQGWTFEFKDSSCAETHEHEQQAWPTLHITARVPNARGEGEIEFTVKRLIPDFVLKDSAAILVSWVKTQIQGVEFHEVDEFFKYKGKLVDDPHQVKFIGKPPRRSGLRSDSEWPV